MLDRVQVLIPAVLLFFAACGNDDNGNQDTLFTGFSGVIILALVIWMVVRMAKKRS